MTAVAMANRSEINTTELAIVTVLAVIDMVIIAYDAMLLAHLLIQ